MNAPHFRAVAAKTLICGEWRDPQSVTEIIDPYRGEVVGTAPVCTANDVSAAVAAALGARDTMAAMPGFERAALLRRAVTLIEAEVESLAELLTRETGKAIKDSESEIRRSIDTVALAAEEAIRIEGRQVPLEGSAMGQASWPGCCAFRLASWLRSHRSMHRSILLHTRSRRRSPPATAWC